jgi:hypothetical protein
MSMHSSFCFTCLCGQRLELEQMEGHCPACYRWMKVEWQAQSGATVRSMCTRDLKPMADTEEEDHDEKHQPGDPTR